MARCKASLNTAEGTATAKAAEIEKLTEEKRAIEQRSQSADKEAMEKLGAHTEKQNALIAKLQADFKKKQQADSAEIARLEQQYLLLRPEVDKTLEENARLMTDNAAAQTLFEAENARLHGQLADAQKALQTTAESAAGGAAAAEELRAQVKELQAGNAQLQAAAPAGGDRKARFPLGAVVTANFATGPDVVGEVVQYEGAEGVVIYAGRGERVVVDDLENVEPITDPFNEGYKEFHAKRGLGQLTLTSRSLVKVTRAGEHAGKIGEVMLLPTPETSKTRVKLQGQEAGEELELSTGELAPLDWGGRELRTDPQLGNNGFLVCEFQRRKHT